MFAAKMVVRSEQELLDLGRKGDGPIPLEPDDDNPKLVAGQHYQVMLMARGRCRCIVQVAKHFAETGII